MTSPAGAAPTSVIAGAGAVWVSNQADFTLTRLDPHTMKIVHTFLPGGGSAGGPGYCSPAAVGEGAVWVTAGDTLVRVSPADNLITKVAGVEPCARDVVVREGAVWLINFLSRSMSRVDPRKRKVVARIPFSFVPVDLATNRDGVWVVDAADDLVVRISPETNRIAGRVRVGKTPIAIAAGEGGVWTTNLDAGTVSRIDPKTLRVVATIKVGPNPGQIAAGEGGVWVTVRP